MPFPFCAQAVSLLSSARPRSHSRVWVGCVGGALDVAVVGLSITSCTFDLGGCPRWVVASAGLTWGAYRVRGGGDCPRATSRRKAMCALAATHLPGCVVHLSDWLTTALGRTLQPHGPWPKPGARTSDHS